MPRPQGLDGGKRILRIRRRHPFAFTRTLFFPRYIRLRQDGRPRPQHEVNFLMGHVVRQVLRPLVENVVDFEADIPRRFPVRAQQQPDLLADTLRIAHKINLHRVSGPVKPRAELDDRVGENFFIFLITDDLPRAVDTDKRHE